MLAHGNGNVTHVMTLDDTASRGTVTGDTCGTLQHCRAAALSVQYYYVRRSMQKAITTDFAQYPDA